LESLIDKSKRSMEALAQTRTLEEDTRRNIIEK